MKPIRVVLVSTMYSPFQVDVAEAMNRRDDVEYHVLFTMMKSRGRGKHWTAAQSDAPWCHISPDWDKRSEITAWIGDKLDELKPDVIVANGILRAHTFEALTRLRKRLRGVPVGYWLEHPDLSRPPWVNLAVEAVTRAQTRWMDFILAIGDRAEKYYRRCNPNLPIHVVPYGQDLSHHFAVARGEVPNRPAFLFSGQLVRRNNVDGMVKAFERLCETHPDRWEFVVAAGGPEEPLIRDLMAQDAVAARSIRFDTEYETWEDRIRPFAESHVLLCPSRHAGWALVVPEAMAAGMPVIATRYVSAARYFVRPEISGLTVTTDPDSIYRAMVRYIEDPEAIVRMGAEARIAAEAGTADFIAARFADAVRRQVQ